ncbi:membrane protein MviN [Syntrophotalea carbinolica DSM 2380]|uniref:Probable lipid II flippase MurJ n=1 Tax=Syntrophotalea carbinolica (strain DSM 2380 / NBRC 103641 / GraBd1) TaxID=338963 RepID=Q3A4P4_SYNC1|nr:murein biosynthesis integral membrane protein MurJ [Syntrophotalea carbinolica]ABA88663.1 membrane protein MviN [Syntrophotalea carbinolica DSM 2380]
MGNTREQKEITRATGVMGFATSLSRVFGLVRDMVVARMFGAGFGADAFFMAFTIPNLLRRFFAEGSLTAAFVPTFSRVYLDQGEAESRRVANICWTLLLLIMAAVTLCGILASPWIVRLIGYGFGAIPGKLALTDFLNRLMFPYIFFVSLLALVTGILNVLGHYFWPSVSPVLLNLAMILSAYFLADYFQTPVVALAIGVLVGGLLQLAIQIPVLRRYGYRFRFDFHFRHPAVRQVARLMLPGIAGVAIYQINIVVTRLLASFLPEGSVSYLYFGQRLFEFPQGIFVVSLAQAVLPAMSRQVALGDDVGFKDSLRYALVLIALVTLPAAVGLVLCAIPVYSLFFMHGAFNYEDVRQSAVVLAAYAPGLLFAGVSRVVVPSFYAMGDTRTPVWISFWTLLVNAGLGVLLMQPYAHVGLACALTLASIFNCSVLLFILRQKLGSLGLKYVLGSMLRILPGTLVMAGFVYEVLQHASWGQAGSFWFKIALLGFAVAGGGSIFAVGCVAMRVPEAAQAYSLLKRKLGWGT